MATAPALPMLRLLRAGVERGFDKEILRLIRRYEGSVLLSTQCLAQLYAAAGKRITTAGRSSPPYKRIPLLTFATLVQSGIAERAYGRCLAAFTEHRNEIVFSFPIPLANRVKKLLAGTPSNRTGAVALVMRSECGGKRVKCKIAGVNFGTMTKKQCEKLARDLGFPPEMEPAPSPTPTP
jgi:histone H3/H4